MYDIIRIVRKRDRIVGHCDMNAFFASVEQVADPRLRGKPVAVVGAMHRSVITTASYEARPFGVKTGMSIPEGKRLCPELILVEADNAKYAHICSELLLLYRQACPRVELYSIDEVFLDFTGIAGGWGGALEACLCLKKDIRAEFQLTCSIGLAPNKLMAKWSSDRQKPDGLVVLLPEALPELMEHIPPEELTGIGPQISKALKELRIETCGDLARYPLGNLREHFGILGEFLHEMAEGHDDSPVVALGEEPPPKSVGHSMTLDRDLTTRREMEKTLFLLSERVARRLRSNALAGRTVSITVRYADFHTFSRQISVREHLDEGRKIFAVSRTLLGSLALSGPVRLLGVHVSQLIPPQGAQSLFFLEERQKALIQTMDRINDRFGEFTVTWGALAKNVRGSSVISPSWRPNRHIDLGY